MGGLFGKEKNYSPNDLALDGMAPQIKSDSRFRSSGVGIDFFGLTSIPNPTFRIPFNQGDLENIPQTSSNLPNIGITPLATSPVNLKLTTVTQVVSPERGISFNNNAYMSQFNLTLGVALGNVAQTNAANTALNNVVNFIQREITPNLINTTINKGFSIQASGVIPAITREVPRLRESN